MVAALVVILLSLGMLALVLAAIVGLDRGDGRPDLNPVSNAEVRAWLVRGGICFATGGVLVVLRMQFPLTPEQAGLVVLGMGVGSCLVMQMRLSSRLGRLERLLRRHTNEYGSEE